MKKIKVGARQTSQSVIRGQVLNIWEHWERISDFQYIEYSNHSLLLA